MTDQIFLFQHEDMTCNKTGTNHRAESKSEQLLTYYQARENQEIGDYRRKA